MHFKLVLFYAKENSRKFNYKKHLQIATVDPGAKDYFLQRLLVELQRGNAASILNTSKSVDVQEIKSKNSIEF